MIQTVPSQLKMWCNLLKPRLDLMLVTLLDHLQVAETHFTSVATCINIQGMCFDSH